MLRCKRLAEICDCVLGCEGTEENVIVYSNVRGLKKCVVLRWEGKKCVLVCWNARGWKKNVILWDGQNLLRRRDV